MHRLSPMATQISVLLENRPGALAELAGVLRQADVNIEAILLEGSIEFGMVRLHLKPLRKAEKALTEAGYQYRVGQTLTLPLTNEPGQLEDVARKLSRAKVNIESLFGTTSNISGTPELILMVDDLPKAKKALGV